MTQQFEDVSIEAVRGYWDRRPCNVRHSPAPLGSREYFDQVEARRYFVEPHIRRFAEFERWRNKRVLEVGCGIGTDTINFARAGAIVTAVDLSAESLALARQRARVYGFEDRITFYEANAECLTEQVPVEPYDLVYSFGVIHHTPHPDQAVAQLRQYMSKGSTAKVMIYHRRSWKVAGIVLREGGGRFWRLDRLVAENSEAQTGCPVTYTYGRDEGRALLERHGLRVLQTEVDHIFPYKVADYVQYRYRRQWWFQLMPPPIFQQLQRRFGWHLCLTAVFG